MKQWLLFSLVAMVLWGAWGFFGKLASRSMSAPNLMLLESVGGLLILPICVLLFARHFRFETNNIDFYCALTGGVLGTVGGLFFYWAITQGDATRVVTITAMYPVVTTILVWLFLNEPLTAKKVAGIAFAMLGLGLLASRSETEPKAKASPPQESHQPAAR